MRVMFVIGSLALGGAQKNVASVANAWAQRGWSVDVVSWDDTGAASYFPLDHRVRWHRLGLAADATSFAAGVRANVTRVRRVRDLIARTHPQVVIGVLDQTNVISILAARLCRTPVIAIEFTAPGVHSIGRAWSVLRRTTYPFATFVGADTRTGIDAFTFVPGHRRRVVSSIVEIAPPAASRRKVVVAASRLVAMKRVDWIVRAFAAVVRREPRAAGWSLHVLGDGPERNALVALAEAEGIGDRVDFAGAVGDVPRRLAESEIFVLASEYEGRSNALCEAVANGCVPVTVDCPVGPREVITHDVNGLLVPGSLEDLTSALAALVANDARRATLREGCAAQRESFSFASAIDSWTQLVQQAASAM